MALRPAAAALFCLGFVLYLLNLLMSPAEEAAHAPPRHARDGRLHLQWVRETPPLLPAWPDQTRLRFDNAVRPVVAGRVVLLNSSRTDSVAAYDLDTGGRRWRFTAEGPVRFAPAVWQGRAYIVSDDGWLYCIQIDDGHELWRFRGAPNDRRVLGNERLVSAWPARGAPVVVPEPAAGGVDAGKATIYFAAGVWPFMGVFIYALDAQSGSLLWVNDGEGSRYMKQPHQADAFAGIAPQGPLAVVGDRLLVPGGRSVPACFDRRTGKLLHFLLADNSKIGGGWDVQAAGTLFLNGGATFDLESGRYLGTVGEPSLLVGERLYSFTGREVQEFDLKQRRVPALGWSGLKKPDPRSWRPRLVGAAAMSKAVTLAAGGGQLFVGTEGKVAALHLPLRKNSTPSWDAEIEGNPVFMTYESGRLLVSTREGRVYCFGPEPIETPLEHFLPLALPMEMSDEWSLRARSVLETTHVREGYGVVWGAGGGRLVMELATQCKGLRLIVVEKDPALVEGLRQNLRDSRIYGERVAVLNSDPASVQLPPYFASLMVSEDLDLAEVPTDAGWLGKAFQSLRPYGSVACLPVGADRRPTFDRAVKELDSSQSRLREADGWLVLDRPGPIPGGADWTHEHADAANTRVSRDRVVKAPLGLLWFGGPPNDPILPRHGHGPQPQVAGGRLFLEGMHLLRALDVYTGRLLWEAPLPNLGRAYDNYDHQPGANASGSNFVCAGDGIYVAHDRACVCLDPETGKEVRRFTLPPFPGEKLPPAWAFVSVVDDYLIAGANPARKEEGPKTTPVRLSSSRKLFLLDRRSGKILWTKDARFGFRHNAICSGGGRLFTVDNPAQGDTLRTASKPSGKAVLYAFDLTTGREKWSTSKDVFGTWMSYSAPADVLVEAGRVARDTLSDEPKGMRAYRAADGKVLWFEPRYNGPAMLHGDFILREGGACDLRTGRPRTRLDPLTGKTIDWTWTRTYGCNTPMASEHLLTFRSGSAGYCDLANDGGTGNFGGFRSSCTNNLVVADGVLCAPDYTRSCTCSYQNQCSVGLVPTADAEMWTYFGKREVSGPVKRAGVLLGAPGNRKAADGTLWLEHPAVGGPSPHLAIRTTPDNPLYFRHHSSRIEGDVSPWIVAAGARGLRGLSLTLDAEAKAERTYTVRLYFVEPDQLSEGKRIFDVAIQGRSVSQGLDVSRDAGGPNRGLIREVKGVKVRGELKIALTPVSGREPILCGVEVVAEGW
jgi:outer membrane protein assembly factor BamB